MTEATSLNGELVAARSGFAAPAERARDQIARRLFGGTDTATVLIAGRYRLGERLGEGGQGTVWRAHDQLLDREVAVKQLHARYHAAPERSARRLRQEARMLSSVAHPNVVAAYDLGACAASSFGERDDEREVLFVVMELVRGQPLREWLAHDRPGHDRILAMMLQIAHGLDAVHAAGLVHCDVKPENVLITGELAKLADFGLAHAARSLVDGISDDELALASVRRSTEAGSGSSTGAAGPIGGTPRYMPPEQFVRGQLDAASDEHALAATVFEALFGAPPHRGDSLAALYADKCQGAPALPDPRFGAAAYAALARSLAVDPRARHGRASTLVESIIVARRRSRRRWPAATLALAGVAGVVWVAVPGPPAACLGDHDPAITDARARELVAQLSEDGDTQGRGQAEREVARLVEHRHAIAGARERVCASEAPSPAVLRCLARLDASAEATTRALDTLGPRELHRVPILLEGLSAPEACVRGEADPADVGPALDSDDPATTLAWARLSAARARLAAGDPTAALAALDALAGAASHGALADEIRLSRAHLLQRLGRYAESEALLLAIYEDALAHDLPLTAARAANGLAYVVGDQLRRFDEGAAWIRHGQTQLERAGGSPELEADLVSSSAGILFLRGHHREARREYERALELELASGRSARGVAAIRGNLAVVLVVTGDPAALDQMYAAHEELEAALGGQHPDVVDSLANLGNALLRFGRHGESRIALERALVLREGIYGPDSVENARVLTLLAELDHLQGDLVGASARMRQASVLRERSLPADHPDRATETLMRVDLMLESDDLDGAERLLARDADRFASTFAADDAINLSFARAAGVVALRRGRAHEASELLGRAVRGATAHGRDTEELLQWLVEAAEAEAALGHREQVRAYLDAAATTAAWPLPAVRERMERLRAITP